MLSFVFEKDKLLLFLFLHEYGWEINDGPIACGNTGTTSDSTFVLWLFANSAKGWWIEAVCFSCA